MKIRHGDCPFLWRGGSRCCCYHGNKRLHWRPAASFNECFSLPVARCLRAWLQSNGGGTGEVTDATLKGGKGRVFLKPRTDRRVFTMASSSDLIEIEGGRTPIDLSCNVET